MSVKSEETESWNGHRGRITIDLINKANLNPNTIFYICGPPKMVENLNQLLLLSKIPDKQIHIETW